MSQPKIVDTLPKEIRGELDAKIITNGFADYRGLAEWLRERGYAITYSTISRHGKKLEQWCDSIRRTTAVSQAIIKDSPDDPNVVGDALLRMVTDRLFTLFYDLGVDERKLDAPTLAKVAKSVADLTRAQVNQKKFEQELRKEIAGKVEKNVEAARAKGIDPQVLQRARELVYGAIE